MMRRLVGTGALAAAGTALAFSIYLSMVRRAGDWPLGDEEPWMIELYQRRLPEVGIASGGGMYAGRNRRLRRTIEEAAELARGTPELADAIRALTPLVLDLPARTRSIARAVDRINEIARDHDVPFYLDVDVDLHHLYLKTYRIERVRRTREGLGEYTALWLSRADRTDLSDDRLGWTRPYERRGMIVLDVIRDYWLSDVGPALAGLEESPVQRIYGQHADRLTEEIAAASAELLDLSPRVWRPVLEARLGCFVEAREECDELAEVVDAAALEVLARKVETHEVQHVIDDADIRHPDALLRAMDGRSKGEITFAAAELSAYLAEVARSGQPHLALVHFLALAEVQPTSAEGFAGRVALDHLTRREETREDLLALPADVLARRAEDARALLFDEAR